MSKNPYQYCAKTNEIEVYVRPFFANDLSEPAFHKYVYVYKVKIINKCEGTIKLLSRKWHIVEEDGTHNVITGQGVVGQQPVLKTDEEFEYASQAILYSKSGMMYGEYNCIYLENDETISVKIPAFSLDLNLDFTKRIEA